MFAILTQFYIINIINFTILYPCKKSVPLSKFNKFIIKKFDVIIL